MVREEVLRSRLDILLDTLSDLRRYGGSVTEEKLRTDRDTQHMVLHALFVATQAAIDVAFHLLADEGRPTPTTYQDSFHGLVAAGVVGEELASRLASWAGLRNLLAHHYPAVDYGKVHRILLDDLPDLEAFAAAVAAWVDRGA